MKREEQTLGYYTISDEDFEFILTKPLFALRMLSFWILKVNTDPRGEVFMLFGPKTGLISSIIPRANSDFWQKANAFIDEVT